jgi:hypothetical protein
MTDDIKELKITIYLEGKNIKDFLNKIDPKFVIVKSYTFLTTAITAKQEDMTNILLTLGEEIRKYEYYRSFRDSIDSFSHLNFLEKMQIDFKFIKVYFEVTNCSLSKLFMRNILHQSTEIVKYSIEKFLNQHSDNDKKDIYKNLFELLLNENKLDQYYDFLISYNEQEFINCFNHFIYTYYGLGFINKIQDFKFLKYVLDHLSDHNKKVVFNAHALLFFVNCNKLEIADMIKKKIDSYPVKLSEHNWLLYYNDNTNIESSNYLEKLIEEKIIEILEEEVIAAVVVALNRDNEKLFDLLIKYYRDIIKKELEERGNLSEKYRKKLDI